MPGTVLDTSHYQQETGDFLEQTQKAWKLQIHFKESHPQKVRKLPYLLYWGFIFEIKADLTGEAVKPRLQSTHSSLKQGGVFRQELLHDYIWPTLENTQMTPSPSPRCSNH